MWFKKCHFTYLRLHPLPNSHSSVRKKTNKVLKIYKNLDLNLISKEKNSSEIKERHSLSFSQIFVNKLLSHSTFSLFYFTKPFSLRSLFLLPSLALSHSFSLSRSSVVRRGHPEATAKPATSISLSSQRGESFPSLSLIIVRSILDFQFFIQIHRRFFFFFFLTFQFVTVNLDSNSVL